MILRLHLKTLRPGKFSKVGYKVLYFLCAVMNVVGKKSEGKKAFTIASKDKN